MVTGCVFIRKVLPIKDRIAGVLVHPGVEIHNGGESSALGVVSVCEEAASGRLKSEGAEVIARDEFAHRGLGEVHQGPSRRTVRGRLKPDSLRPTHQIQAGSSSGGDRSRSKTGNSRRFSCMPELTQQSSLSPIRIRVLGSATGRFCRRTAFTSVNIAAFAPMPRARVRMTVAAKPVLSVTGEMHHQDLDQDSHEDLRAHHDTPRNEHVRCHRLRRVSHSPANTCRLRRASECSRMRESLSESGRNTFSEGGGSSRPRSLSLSLLVKQYGANYRVR